MKTEGFRIVNLRYPSILGIEGFPDPERDDLVCFGSRTYPPCLLVSLTVGLTSTPPSRRQFLRAFKGLGGVLKSSIYKSVVGEDLSLNILKKTDHRLVIRAVWLALGLYLAVINVYIFATGLSFGSQTIVKIFEL